MQFLLTFLATVASLSVSAIVGVHAAQCAVCPATVSDETYDRKCYRPGGEAGEEPNTVCYYKFEDEPVSTDFCRYDASGDFIESYGVQDCPFEVAVDSTDCPTCA
ncbi:hypothetical protein BDN67DRAFT_1013080 [Paxillus ammoniavirescens]|nr:hypothetical protein BDN67DRAFT_1013080 [Paxillus ammoniavirescens]